MYLEVAEKLTIQYLFAERMEDKCFFEKLFSCLEKDPLSQTSAERIMRASKQYGDGLHTELEQQQNIAGSIEGVLVHRKCVDKYCHKKTIQKVLHEKARSASAEDLVSNPKRARRSEQLKFLFLQHCLFCGEKSDVVKDPKHPGRWRPAYSCREGETFGNKGLREATLEACEVRKDTQSEQIRVRMGGVLTDLHAADVRYHVDCKATFLSPKSIKAAVHRSSGTELTFDSVVKYFTPLLTYTQYMKAGGHVLSRRQLISKVVEKFGRDMITLSSPGYSMLLAFKSSAAKVFHVIPDDTYDMSEAIEKVAKKIKAEIENIETDRKNYHSHIDKDICSKFQSNTLDDV